MDEAGFIAAIRGLPLHPGAGDLRDDVARLTSAGDLVVSTDTIVEGVHFLPDDPPRDVAWKLVAVNLSDLAAKGASPVGLLLNYTLTRGAGGDAFDRDFLVGLGEALTAYGCRLVGGDTVALPAGSARVLGATVLGTMAAGATAPSRGGAGAGDALLVTGTIGDAGAGLAIARAGSLAAGGTATDTLRDAYRRPVPRLAEGRALAPLVTAMMDVSDGLLIDAARMAAASGVAVTIDLATVPLSAALQTHAGDNGTSRMAAATAGDDYQLLFAGPADSKWPVAATRIGCFAAGAGLTLVDRGRPVALPARLGFEHRGDAASD